MVGSLSSSRTLTRALCSAAVVSLASGLTSGCNPAATDASYWDRSPALFGDAGAAKRETEGGASEETPEDPAGSVDPTTPEATASTACARVELSTLTYGGEYAPENVGAVWITTADGVFVKTLEVWGTKRRKHAVAWLASSKGNEVDAISGATRRTAGPHISTWSCKTANGSAAAPGSYRLHAEFTEENSSAGSPAGPHRTLAFELGTAVAPASLSDDGSYRGVRIVPLP